jgi:hypothetical protein
VYAKPAHVVLSSKGSKNFSSQATLTCPAVHILCMAILGGWVPDPARRLFELVAATQCTFKKPPELELNCKMA